MAFDYTDVPDAPRIPDWPALCLQLVECLRWYEYYLTGFQLEDYVIIKRDVGHIGMARGRVSHNHLVPPRTVFEEVIDTFFLH